MVVRLPVVLALGVLLGFVPPALANHPQVAHGDVVVFDHRTGNEWWVEVVLSGGASGSVSGVQAMDTDGAWVAMSAHPEWAAGDWAASFHIEPGHLVKFRALWSGGDQVESCWFTHPAGVEQCPSSSSSSTTTTSSSSTTSGPVFDAIFSGVKGNEWWVEATVTANQPIAKVEARVDCAGAWRLLPKQSWGSYAASFNVPSGHKVDFRATSTGGATDLSVGYLWPQATPTAGCGSSTTTTTGPAPFRATYSGVKGNEWWIQANVAATGGTLSKVDVQLFDGGRWLPYQPLTKQSWGGWAASYHAPNGYLVQLRATSTAGDTSLSTCYRWTAATAMTCPTVWPVEGMTFRYQFEHRIDDERSPELLRFEESWSNLTATFHNGDWQITCTEHKRVERPQGTLVSDTTTTRQSTGGMPVISTSIAVGQTGTMFAPHGCSDARRIDADREPDWFHAVATPQGGVVTVAAADYLEVNGTRPRYFTDIKADRTEGIVLSWDTTHAEYECECYWDNDKGRLLSTDIPIGPVVSRAEQKAALGPWPVDGSHLLYTAQTQTPNGWRNQTSLDLTYSASTARWTGTCRVDTYSPPGGYDHYVGTTTESATLAGFPSAPGSAPVGSTVTVQLPRRCALTPVDAKVGTPSTADYFGPPNGDVSPQFGAEWHTIEVLSGQGTATPSQGKAHWDPESGLLMDWDWTLADGTHAYGQQVNLGLRLR